MNKYLLLILIAVSMTTHSTTGSMMDDDLTDMEQRALELYQSQQ